MSELNDLKDYAPDARQETTADEHVAPWPGGILPTGDYDVDSVLSRLEGVQEAPVTEHGAKYSEIHDSLLAVLDAEER
ncbi:hypothetical protein AB6813_04415 [bacterium RCC_150]